MLNLSHDWLHSMLPFVLGKIDRVSYGILSDLDLKLVRSTRRRSERSWRSSTRSMLTLERPSSATPTCLDPEHSLPCRSWVRLPVQPWLCAGSVTLTSGSGKDVPSAASEFAHPDVVIGLTIMAFRYEGRLALARSAAFWCSEFVCPWQVFAERTSVK